MQRREKYSHPCPEGVLVLTSAVDVQKDRLECLITGHGYMDEKWFIDHRICYGEPTGDAVWNEMQQILTEHWILPNGKELTLACTFIDSGFLTPKVYEFCKRMQPHRVYASKGLGGPGRPAVGRPSKSNSLKLPVFPVGVNGLKELLFNRLKVDEPGPTYMHIPDHFDDEWCLQLTAEKAVKRYSRGIPRIDWVKTRNRNEALDLTVLNLAAFQFLNVNFDKVQKSLEEVRKPEVKELKFPQRMMKPKPSWVRRFR